jgi:hypothetical protein
MTADAESIEPAEPLDEGRRASHPFEVLEAFLKLGFTSFGGPRR